MHGIIIVEGFYVDSSASKAAEPVDSLELELHAPKLRFMPAEEARNSDSTN